jgi:ribosomal protein L10
MKSKAQKETEIKEAKELLGKSDALVFVDFNKVSAEDLRNLRREVRAAGGSMLVLKKRLLGVALKEKGVEFDSKQFSGSLGTAFFGNGLELASAPVYRFFNSLGGTDKEAKAEAMGKILGGLDLAKKEMATREKILFYGQLPPREVALAMVLGMFVAPLRSFMYLVSEKSKKA